KRNNEPKNLVQRGWWRTVRKGNRRCCIVRRDLHRLTFVGKQEAAEGHASKKHREDRQYHNAVASRRIKSSQLLSQKFLVALVHFLEISLAGNVHLKRAKAASVRAFRVFAAYRMSSSSELPAPHVTNSANF